ncbi:hypothetical protein E4U55_004475, partial [Claviceps digitariae]
MDTVIVRPSNVIASADCTTEFCELPSAMLNEPGFDSPAAALGAAAASIQGGSVDGNGRDETTQSEPRRHGKGYWLPIDNDEQDRLDAQHNLFLSVTDGKLGLAPVIEPRQVLDIATGTGIWAFQY